jgi:TolB-like protein/tetratricopeptide (TPR) repeat protein
MAESPSRSGQKPDPPTGEPRLESWGEIASYLRRDIRTVQRWEKYLSLPVRRLQIGKLGSVYAFRSELDKWYQERQPRDIEPESEDGNGSTASSDPPPQPEKLTPKSAVDQQPPSPPSKTITRLRWAFAVAVLLAMVFAIYGVLKPSLPVLRSGEKPRLFVRPFTNSSGKSQNDEFISGLTDETITQLGRIDPAQLGVISPTSSKLLAAKPIDEVGRLLNVQYVLEGSVSRNANQVVINVALISVQDQTHLWAESYTDDVSDILRVQEDVSRKVAQQIRAKIPKPASPLPESPAPKRIDPEAYDAYLKGRLYWTNRDLPKSVAAFQDALQKEPDYTHARAGLASAYVLLGQAPNDGMPPNDAIPKARTAAQQALDADPNNSEAQCVLANIALSYDWDFPAAERGYERAIKQDPNNSTAYEWYGHYLIVRNRLPEAQAATSHALDLDPVSPVFNSARAETFYFARDYDASIAQAKRTLEQYPSFLPARVWLASAYREKKMYPEAIQEFDKSRQNAKDNPAVLTLYGHSLAVSGDKAGALKVLSRLQGALASGRYVPAIYFAVMHAGLGDSNAAFAWFDKAVKERDDRLVYLAVDPLADPLRQDPRFGKLLSRIGLLCSGPGCS